MNSEATPRFQDGTTLEPHFRTRTALSGLVTRPRDWFQANLVLGTCLVVTVLGGWGLLWAAGEIYESIVEANGVSLLDQPVLDWVLSIRQQALTAAIAWYSNTGGPVIQPIIVGAVVLFLCWKWRSWTPFVLTALAVGGSLIATVVGKDLVGRARPPLADAIPPYEVSPSFPSGHTLNAMVIAGILCYLMLHWFRRPPARIAWIVGFSLYALTMGLSRVYLGHHWLTDVLAGWLLGLAWVFMVITLHRLWLTARARHGEPRWNRMLDATGPK